MSVHFEQDEMQLKLQYVLKIAPAWPVECVQPFTWPYGPRELIAERKKVAEIMLLRAKVEKPVDHNGNPTKTGYPMSFQNAFVTDDYARTYQMLDVEAFRDWRSLLVKEHLHTFPVGPSGTAERRAKRESDWCASMNVYYGWIKGLLAQTSNNLLEMQALCSELKPETLALVKRCSSYEELDRSMLMMKPEPTAEGFPFRAPNDPVETPQTQH